MLLFLQAVLDFSNFLSFFLSFELILPLGNQSLLLFVIGIFQQLTMAFQICVGFARITQPVEYRCCDFEPLLLYFAAVKILKTLLCKRQ